jgi:hypothetical protein
MFGHSAEPAKREQRARRMRSIPPGLVPFVPVVGLFLLLVGFVINVWVGVALAVALVSVVIRLRYQDVKGVDYATLRRNDPWARAWDSWRRGGPRWGEENRPPE